MCDWRLSHLRRLILVTYASSQWRGKKLLIDHVVNIKTLNGSENDGRSFKRWYGFYAFTGGREHFIFFLIEIENFRGEGNILMRHTHDTTFFWKKSWKKESEQFFILFLKKMENLRRFFSISEVRGGKIFLNVVWLKYDHFLLLQNW
jgi:hypothetical protein